MNSQYDSVDENPYKNKEQKTKKSKTSYINNSRMFEIQVPLELKASINDRAYVEYILSSSNTKANKLAAVGDSGSNSYKNSELVGATNYAKVPHNHFADPTKKMRLSNEKVKFELTKEYFANPEHYSTSVAVTLVEQLKKNYSFSPEELEMLTDKSKEKDRLGMIAFAKEKMDKGDKQLIDTVESINVLMNTLKQVDKFKQNSFSKSAADALKKELENKCFNEDGVFNWEKVDYLSKEAIISLAVEGKKGELRSRMEEFFPEVKADSATMGYKVKTILEGAEEVSHAHQEITDKLDVAGKVNGNIQIREQFVMLDEFIRDANKAIESGSNADAFMFKKNMRERVGGSNINEDSFSGIFKKIDSVTGTSLQKKIDSKKKIDIKETKKEIIKGINEHIFGEIKKRLAEDGVGVETSNQIIANYKELAKEISSQRKEKQQKGLPFGAKDVENLQSNFSEKNTKILLESIKNPIALKIISENSGISIHKDFPIELVDKASETMNAYNMLHNNAIKSNIQEDEIDMVMEQSLTDPHLIKSVGAKLHSDANVPEQLRDKGSINDRVQNVVGKQKFLELRELSKDLNRGITAFALSRETATNFKNCLTGAIVSKTSVETLASSTSQCEKALIDGIKSEANQAHQHMTQSNSGFATGSVMIILFAIQEEYLKAIENQLLKSQEDFNDRVAQMVQDINSASTTMEREARLELGKNSDYGGLSAAVVHSSELKSFRDALNKENLADKLLTDDTRSVDDILNDNKYNIKQFSLQETPKSPELTEEMKRGIANSYGESLELESEKDNILKNKEQELGSLEDSAVNEDSRKEQTQRHSERISTARESAETLDQQGHTKGATTNEGVRSLNQQKQGVLKNKIESNRPTLEHALAQLHKLQKEKAKAILLTDNDEAIELLRNEIALVEQDKLTLTKELIKVSLIKMEENSLGDNKHQPTKRITRARELIESLIDGTSGLDNQNKKNIWSDALGLMNDNNKTMSQTFAKIRDTSSLETLVNKGENGINSVYIATDEKSLMMSMYKENESYLEDKSNDFQLEKNLAFDAMEKLMEGTALSTKIGTFDGFKTKIDNASKVDRIRDADERTRSIQSDSAIARGMR